MRADRFQWRVPLKLLDALVKLQLTLVGVEIVESVAVEASDDSDGVVDCATVCSKIEHIYHKYKQGQHRK